MRKFFILLACTLVFFVNAQAQYTLRITVRDSASHAPLVGASVFIQGTSKGAVSDLHGKAILKDLPAGQYHLAAAYMGYRKKLLDIHMPGADSLAIDLAPEEAEMEVVTVSSTRTNSRIEDLPTKIEVLGTEELVEENGIKPSNISGLLGDIAGIQFQLSSPVTGNAEMRVQGLDGKYTQILRDGYPLFGGYSGSFSILQIPPLDLKQIEIIKGASSTLYGGGAIAGLINLISKTPVLGKPERSFTLNFTSLGEETINGYYSKRNNKTGITLFGGLTHQRAVDTDKDGFSDVPKVDQAFIHPTLYFYPSARSAFSVGLASQYENRVGGEMGRVNNASDAANKFFVQNTSYRNTLNASWEHTDHDSGNLVAKASLSHYLRDITTNRFLFNAAQLSYYSELTYFKNFKNDKLVLGLNINGNTFSKLKGDSISIPSQVEFTPGIFAQNQWDIQRHISLETGLRTDYSLNYGFFVLPRISALFKISQSLTSRLGWGMGYKTPFVLAQSINETDYPRYVNPNVSMQPERSSGANWDINYKNYFGDWLSLTVNQSFFYTVIQSPIALSTDSAGNIHFYNAGKPIRTMGFETYVRATLGEDLELYLGYVFTDARKLYDSFDTHVTLIARNKYSATAMYELNDHWRIGLEFSEIGKQYLDNYTTSPAYTIMAAMLGYQYKKLKLVLNCENLLDYRQNKHERVILPPYDYPGFKELWAPIDGRVVNLSMNISF